jgi:hypothetical protein
MLDLDALNGVGDLHKKIRVPVLAERERDLMSLTSEIRRDGELRDIAFDLGVHPDSVR